MAKVKPMSNVIINGVDINKYLREQYGDKLLGDCANYSVNVSADGMVTLVAVLYVDPAVFIEPEKIDVTGLDKAEREYLEREPKRIPTDYL